MEFICYKKCTNCEKIRKELITRGYDLSVRDYKEDVLSYEEIKKIFEKSNKEIKKFFNTSGLVYKEKNLKEVINNLSVEDALNLLSENPMLIKRPICINDDTVLIGNEILKNLL